MSRSMLNLILTVFSFSIFSFPTLAEVPSACRECMSQCPHLTRDLKACDMGCPDVCSNAQKEEVLNVKKTQSKGQSCYSCMSECPHLTRDFKACDQGCPDVCDQEGLKNAFIKANAEAKKCGNFGSSDLKSKSNLGADGN